jgi:hypothetical protein
METGGVRSRWLPADSIAETDLLAVGSAQVMREQRGPQIGLECV